MKFLVDMPLSPGLTVILKQKGFEAVHAYHTGLARATDEEIIEYARRNDYIIITADLDYPRILALAQTDKPTIILIRGGNYNEQQTSSLISHMLNIISPQQIISSIIVIDKTRIRRHELPL